MKKLSLTTYIYVSFVILFTFCLVISLYIFTEKNKNKYVNSFVIMDKKFSQVLYGHNCEYVTSLVRNEAFRIEEILSCDFYGSDVEKINNAHGKWVKINDITIKTLQKLIGILYYIDKSNPLYLHLFKKNQLNDDNLSNIDCDLIKIDEDLKRVKLENENIQISLNDTIEAAICNKAMEIYKNEKISKAIFKFGSITGYLNCNDYEIKNGFVSEYETNENSSEKKTIHHDDAFISSILSKILVYTNSQQEKKIKDQLI